MMSSLRSAAPERAWIPISKVPPSPAHAITTVSASPLLSSPALRPEAVEAAASNAVWKMGTLRDVWGKGPSITDQQQAGITRAVWGPSAFSAKRIACVAPHPWHATWPDVISSSVGIFAGLIPSLLSS